MQDTCGDYCRVTGSLGNIYHQKLTQLLHLQSKNCCKRLFGTAELAGCNSVHMTHFHGLPRPRSRSVKWKLTTDEVGPGEPPIARQKSEIWVILMVCCIYFSFGFEWILITSRVLPNWGYLLHSVPPNRRYKSHKPSAFRVDCALS